MKNLKNCYKRPLLAFVLFLVIQLVVGLVAALPLLILTGLGSSLSDTYQHSESIRFSTLAATLIISSLVTIWVMAKPMKMLTLRDSFHTTGLARGWWVIPVSFVCILASNVFSELFELPDLIGEQIDGMSNTFLGVLAIAIAGPVCEEVTLRGAIQGWLHRHGVRARWAILFSAFLFGVMHLNPIQIPFAMYTGLILGLVYWKTQSLLMPCLIHILNNGFACLMMNVCPEDLSLVAMLGGTVPAVSLSTVIIAIGAWLLYRWGMRSE